MIEFRPIEAERSLWAAYHAFRADRHAEVDPSDPLPPDEHVEKALRFADPHQQILRYLFLDGDGVAGSLTLWRVLPASPEYEEHRRFMRVDAQIRSGNRGQGIGLDFARKVLATAKEWEKEVITASTHEETGQRFLARLGAKARYREAESRLYMSEVDWDQVQRWLDEGLARNPGISLELFPTDVPDELLDAYLPVLTEINNDMPDEEMETGEDILDRQTWEILRDWLANREARHPTVLTLEPDGEVSALTDVMFEKAVPHAIHQWATGVRKHHRGRGLGKLVKAKMLLYLREQCPEALYVKTENARSNDAMLHINIAMGFRFHREHVAYQMKTAELDESLAL
ncbi:MAG TPA: hypothetical protein VI541_05065 [Actinomycetota bacterium]|nr:hypothetical protein [Actinomycetota bacterium]